MNKISERILPIMSKKEVFDVIKKSYENDAQTLANEMEANILKFKEITDIWEGENEKVRWKEIKSIFIKNKKNNSNDRMKDIVKSLEVFNKNFNDMKEKLFENSEKLN
jgi:hypothetical protein